MAIRSFSALSEGVDARSDRIEQSHVSLLSGGGRARVQPESDARAQRRPATNRRVGVGKLRAHVPRGCLPRRAKHVGVQEMPSREPTNLHADHYSVPLDRAGVRSFSPEFSYGQAVVYSRSPQPKVRAYSTSVIAVSFEMKLIAIAVAGRSSATMQSPVFCIIPGWLRLPGSYST